MVRVINASAFREQEPPKTREARDSERRIRAPGPLYGHDSVKEILDVGGPDAVRIETRNCRKDLRDLEIEPEELPGLIREAVTNGTYRGSMWCKLSEDRNQRDAVSWAACDEYVVPASIRVGQSGRTWNIHYYVKFAIGQAGSLLLLVSYHTS